jgi:hypothetical protein
MFFVAEGINKVTVTVMEFFLGQFSQTVVIEGRGWGFVHGLATTGLEIRAASEEVQKSCLFTYI